mmetsp:Transcript_26850/g.54971  ORF Transcript_26850/g.54971 Transcript_26850/m.54971 type:complete len:162 (-) Transcript_26850:340-825(-)|eukprot:CAMPEP_0183307560 /NCGR_PEP_ID=MMETSP0160_2-20130417/18020_1 /TAXON_ID=2839 ORGANISM="Odontella Sinensis, Strain Grunow 1884" /NCGR_SAMPLE_ID=MMETSP0160_2 /ASSEMBLY_ACC=CAM_ASM_000250 /LENGTH=161 /DNA_ID=CAMNT_0025471169 /DNA_START=19 /DNA_END=504 /DNA_ORIENTATION=+
MADDDSIPEIPNLDDMDENERRRRADDFHGELIRFLTESREMRQTARSAVQQSLWAGSGAMAGSLLLGPVGGLVGGVAGSVVGFFKSDNYDGVVLAVLKLEGGRKDAVMKEVWEVLLKAGATVRQLESAAAFRNALRQFAEQDAVRNGVWRACLHSVHEEG